MLKLRPLTPAEFPAWHAHEQEIYIAELCRNGLTAEAAAAKAARSMATNFPFGLESPGQHVYVLVHEGATVGHLWWGPSPEKKDVAWIYAIEVIEQMRGKGFGRAAMQLAEADAKAKGFDRLGLHVFGYNEVALNLYRSLGFATKNIIMEKNL